MNEYDKSVVKNIADKVFRDATEEAIKTLERLEKENRQND